MVFFFEPFLAKIFKNNSHRSYLTINALNYLFHGLKFYNKKKPNQKPQNLTNYQYRITKIIIKITLRSRSVVYSERPKTPKQRDGSGSSRRIDLEPLSYPRRGVRDRLDLDRTF